MSAAYKRLNLTLRVHIDWEWRDEKKYEAIGYQKKAEVAILISEKIVFRQKMI